VSDLAHPAAAAGHQAPRPVVSPGRLEAFSDGVLAIAITLLVLDLHPSERRGGVAHDLLHLWPSYLAYVASFLYIGVVWVNHHALFTRIAAVDVGLLWRNLFVLLAASALPFPAAQLASAMHDGTHGDQVAALTLYSVVAAGIATGWLALYHHLHRHPELRAAHVGEGFFRNERRRAAAGLLAPAVPLLVSLADPTIGIALLLATPLFYALTAEGLRASR